MRRKSTGDLISWPRMYVSNFLCDGHFKEDISRMKSRITVGRVITESELEERAGSFADNPDE